MSEIRKLHINTPFLLESGEVLPSLTIAYHFFGDYNPNKNNVIWVCHALTANSDVFDWWNGLFGDNSLFNSKDFVVVCANIIGSCYGTTGPTGSNFPEKLKYDHFPLVTPKDMAKAHQLLKSYLGIEQIFLTIGASLGGQQAMEFALLEQNNIQNLILIATNAVHSPYGKAFNESQRLAIYADNTWGQKNTEAAKKGLIAARSIGMLSYRSYEGYAKTQTDANANLLTEFRATTYQKYQGEKLANRFDAYSYVSLTKSMDAHNIGRGYQSIEKALGSITATTLVIGINSDLLFPPSEQKFLAKHITKATYKEIDSLFGHDGFLVETNTLSGIVKEFLNIK